MRLGLQPKRGPLRALGQRAQEVADRMGAHAVASVFSAYAALGTKPLPTVLKALVRRARKVVPDMNAQDLTSTLSAYVMITGHLGDFGQGIVAFDDADGGSGEGHQGPGTEGHSE